MKRRLLSFLLMLACMLSAFAGCTSAREQNTAVSSGGMTDASADAEVTPINAEKASVFLSSEQSKVPTPIPQGYLSLVFEGESRYRIVYDSSMSLRVNDMAEELAKTISEATGILLPVCSDSQADGDEYEIRIGHTSHVKEDEAFFASYADISGSGYAVCVKGKTVYIYAESEVGIYNAIKYFHQKAVYVDSDRSYFGIRDGLHVIFGENLIPSSSYLGFDENYLYFTVQDGTLDEGFARVSFTGNKAWRIQTKQTQADTFRDIGASQRLSLSLQEEPVLFLEPIQVTENDQTVIATAPDGSRAELRTDVFSLKFYTPEGNLSQHISNLFVNQDGSIITGDLLPEEGVFGTGERFNTVNQRGRKINMFTKDIWSRSDACYLVIPLLTFTRGSGVFLNIYEEIDLTLGRKEQSQADVWTANAHGADMDCYIYTSNNMADAIYGYSILSGFAEMPEEWTYGMLICRYSPDLSQKWQYSALNGRNFGVYDTIALMETYDLPWTGILAEGWGFSVASKYDDLKELCDYVHSLGKKFLVYIPIGCMDGVGQYYPDDFLVSMTTESGTRITNLPGVDSNNPDSTGSNGNYKYLDITNPTAVEWFFGQYWDYLTNEIGVDGCKIDFCELLPEYTQLHYYDRDQPTAGSHHWYPTAFCALFFDMLAEKPDSGMNFTRGGGIGAQRSPYMWAGDQIRCYDGIKYQLVACLSSGISGLPFMSYDMSGYQYGYGDGNGTGFNDRPYNEAQVFVRGLQFTAFSINMQQHGKVRQAFEFALGYAKHAYQDNVYSKIVLTDENGETLYVTDENGNRIPLTDPWGDVVTDRDDNILYLPQYDYLIKPGEMSYITDIYRGYLKLHEYLTPYINEYSAIACETGMPLMRAMVLHYQNDPNVYNIDDQYMFGDAFLIAPILNDSYQRDIYLPEGKWKDMNTGEIYSVGSEGMTLKGYKAELEHLPLFYNINTTSETAEELLPGMEEILQYIDSVDCSAFYEKTGINP